MAYQNNQMTEYSFVEGEAEVGHAVPVIVKSIALQGHRSDVRKVIVSSDGESLLTISAGLVSPHSLVSKSILSSKFMCFFASLFGSGL